MKTFKEYIELMHSKLRNDIRSQWCNTPEDVKEKLSNLHNELPQEKWDAMSKREKCEFMGQPYTRRGYYNAEKMWREA